MLYRVIDAAELPALVAAFMERYEVIAPVRSGHSFAFEAVGSFDEIVLDYPTTITSPKKYVLPPRETLFRFDAEANEVTDYVEAVTPRVIFGVHACDINALNSLDRVFRDARYPDPYYEARRDATMVVGISCTPSEGCFCHLMDADEARTGYDLFQEVPMLMDAFHSDPFWEELGGRCLSCTACSSVCPTCYCFDIRDTLDPDGVHGRRERTWDACTSPQFAVVAGGHNFRADGRNRVRHRMYHKLNGFLATHDRNLCVGCGRCVYACKADISPIEVLRFFERKGAENAD